MKYIFTMILFTSIITNAILQTKSFYDFTVKTIDGKDFNLSELKGKKILVVNTASK